MTANTATFMQQDAEQWLALGTSTVYEASQLACALGPGFVPAWQGARLCAPAYTVTCEPGDNLPVHLAVEAAPQGCVLVVQGGGVLVGYWGEVLTRAAQARGITGLLIDGGLRDVDALESLAFPAFCRGVSMLGTAKSSLGEIGQPVKVGGVRITTGDLVMADRDGVLVLPADHVVPTLAAAVRRRDQELDYLRRIAAGELTLDIYGWRGLVESAAPGAAIPQTHAQAQPSVQSVPQSAPEAPEGHG